MHHTLQPLAASCFSAKAMSRVQTDSSDERLGLIPRHAVTRRDGVSRLVGHREHGARTQTQARDIFTRGGAFGRGFDRDAIARMGVAARAANLHVVDPEAVFDVADHRGHEAERTSGSHGPERHPHLVPHAGRQLRGAQQDGRTGDALHRREMSVPVATSTSTGMPSTSHPSSTPDSAMQATSLSMPRSRQMRNDSSAQHGSPAAAMRGVTRMPRLP